MIGTTSDVGCFKWGNWPDGPDASTSLAEIHKTSQKNIRLWERLPDAMASNPLECQAVVLSANLAVLATTGEATLHQGTAEPLLIACDGLGDLLPRVVEATAVGAQLNWGSPGVARRYQSYSSERMKNWRYDPQGIQKNSIG